MLERAEAPAMGPTGGVTPFPTPAQSGVPATLGRPGAWRHMDPWAPFPVADWPEVAELLTDSGKAWPKGAAIYDLRWHFDQDGRVPGRSTLVSRWSWGDKRVRRMLADPETWWDPSKGAVPYRRTRQGSSEGPVRVHTRVDPQPQTQPQATEVSTRPLVELAPDPRPQPTSKAAARRVYTHWREYHPRAPRAATGGHLAEIDRRLRDEAARGRQGSLEVAERLCVALIDWAHKAYSASYLQWNAERGKAFLGISSLFKAKGWGDRVEDAHEWLAAGRPNGAARAVAPKRRDSARDTVRHEQTPAERAKAEAILERLRREAQA